ncbi:hypothetical protein SteCoe_37889 [Stentor coeruleus]|uniref:Glutathione S-transferase n=1 Tax=Stentor coeruleus TaxID=5963 RepID=A0A1R2AM87_9CILI|nr:hypothetical protein SteCoe_37889 [Stentor coeruleus]
MSDLTVYGTMISQPTRSVLSFCRLSGLEFQYNDLDFIKRNHCTDEFAKINPFQAMPAIVHNSFNVWESVSCVMYLADVFNVDNQWYPKDLKIRARINSYLLWHDEGVRIPLDSYLKAKYLVPKFGGPKLTEETEAPYKDKLQEWYNTFKWQLAETHYAGRTDTPTIADVFAYNEIANASVLMDLNEQPEIKKWYDEIGAIPVVQEYTQQAFEMMRKFFS